MSGILFWMIFIQVSIFFIGAGLLVAWFFVESSLTVAEASSRVAARNRFRPRKRRAAMSENLLPDLKIATDATS